LSTLQASALVPRGALETLATFTELVSVWNSKINLLSRRESPQDLWQRHIADSAQLMQVAPRSARTWLDLGSGAGFPGLVCAVIARAEGHPLAFTLVEADGRKAAFLREAARRLHVDATVLDSRIERLSLPPQDVISARALAALDRLIRYAAPFCHPGSTLLFPKGRQADSELTLARRAWHIRAVRVPSRTDPEATILKLSEVSRRR
jgi:16S rRNA (guanine527-N7)-methyltransferase